MIRISAQGNDAFIVDSVKLEFCYPDTWTGTVCTTYSVKAVGGNNLVGWCISTDHAASEPAEFGSGAFLDKCCDSLDIVLTNLSTANFAYGQYYGCA